MTVGFFSRIAQATNATGPRVTLWDYRRPMDMILEHPSLEAFFDFSNPATMTVESGNRLAQVNDLGPRGKHLVATGDARPTFYEAGINSMPAAHFDGTNWMSAEDLFSGSALISVVATILAEPPDSESRNILTDADVASSNPLYITSNHVRAWSNNVSHTILSIGSEVSYVETASNFLTRSTAAAARGSAWTTGTIGDSRIPPIGKGNVGRNTDVLENFKFVGFLGWLAIFREDLQKNDPLRGLLYEYHLRRYRRST